nr:thiamine pyrophosphate-dependent enzyme [Amycolatopsis sp. CA-230715]
MRYHRGWTVAQTAVRILAEAGVRRAYTVPGESFLELLDVLQLQRSISLITTRHEAGAAFMAEAEGKLRDVPALVLGSKGPGIANLAIGVHTAYQDETPMIVILGETASNLLKYSGPSDPDLTGMFSSFVKWAGKARSATDVPKLLVEAINAARTGRRGPAVLAVPSDFWVAPFDQSLADPDLAMRTGTLHRSADEVAALLADSKYPVVIAGGRARWARDELVMTAEHLGFAVYNAFRRQDAFPETHERYAGHLGVGIPARQLDAMERADLVLCLGTRLDEVTTQNYRYPLPSQTLVMVGTGPADARRGGLTFRVASEVEPFLRELRSVAAPRTRRSSAANAAVHTFMTPPDTRDSVLVHPADVVRTVRRHAPEDTIVTNDASAFAGFVHRYWCFTAARSQLGPANGAMGYAVPAAVAAKLAEPERTVFAMVGDGAALMTGQEIETAVRYRVPIIVIVFQNGVYGTMAMHQARTHGRLAGVTLPAVDFAAWARGLGAAGYMVEDPQELEPTISRALRHQRPVLIDVRTDPDVITPETRLSELYHGDRSG